MNRTRGAPARRTCAVAATLAVACSSGGCEFRTDEGRIVEAWLTCIDCTDGEREEVREIGARAVPYLGRAVLGPGPLRVAQAEQLALRVHAGIPSPAVPESTFVRRATEGFVANYQSRAAMSLADIGTGDAIAQLRTAAAHDSATADTSASGGGYYRADARRTVLKSLAMAAAAPFPGHVTAGRVSFHDTIVVRADTPGGLADRAARLVGAPFSDRMTVHRWGDDSLAIIAGAAAGEYALELAPPAADGVRWAVPLTVQRFRYQTRDPTSAPEMTGSDWPRLHFPVLGMTGPADSIDFYRFHPVDTLALRVELDWVLPGEMDLAWFECPPPNDTPSPLLRAPGGAKPVISEMLIPAEGCLLVGVISRDHEHRVLARLEITRLLPPHLAAEAPVP